MKLNSKFLTLTPLVLAAAAMFLAVSASALPISNGNKYGKCQDEYQTCKSLGRNDCRTKYMACIAKKESSATQGVFQATIVQPSAIR